MEKVLQEKIEELIKKKERLVIAIDGMCASGKSTLAKEIKEQYQAEVIRVDDFYLPEELRTEERYEEPGGNVHYERFLEEVIKPLENKDPIKYRSFNCATMEYEACIEVPKASIYVIEGTYSMREEFRHVYDLTIFMDCDERAQEKRIKRRNGKEKYEMFTSKWIPLERLYLEELEIKDQCEIQLSTSKSRREIMARSLMAIVGVLLAGMSVGLFNESLFGTDPFTCFMNGILSIIPIGYGSLYVIVNVLMLVLIFILDKKYIGFATAINIFLLGYVIQFSVALVHELNPDPTLLVRIIYLAVGVVILCFASALYFTANMGVSTYDAIALMLSEKRNWKFKYCRIGTDLFCVIIGLVLGAIAGIGTIITAFFMGPIISFFRKNISEPFLEKIVK